MRVAFDYQIFTLQRYGGISRYFYELTKSLGTIDPSIKYQINSPIYVNNYLYECRDEHFIEGIRMPKFKGSSKIYTLVNRLLSPCFFRDHIDIVHETYYSQKTVAPKKSQIVVTIHDMIHELYPKNFSKYDRTAEYKKNAIDRADHIICVSENTRKDLIRLYDIDQNNISVVYHGFNLPNHSIEPSVHKKKPFILYVGSRGGYKNFERLITAYASTPFLRESFDLIAFGGGCFNRNEIELIKKLRISEEKVFQISGDDKLLSSLYKEAQLFVYPSIYEGFGIPLLEAMSYKCPVACSNTSSIPEVVGNAALLFDPLDIDSIAEALIKLSFDSNLRENLIAKGSLRLKKFSWVKCADQTLDIYRSLIS